MISREQMEPERSGYLDRSPRAQLEQIATTLDDIAGALAEAVSLEAARDGVDRTMAYTEWTVCVLDGNPIVEVVVDCHGLMGRLRGEWSRIEESAELRAWVRRDVIEMRDRLRHTARAAA
jgi:hypothetical protein